MFSILHWKHDASYIMFTKLNYQPLKNGQCVLFSLKVLSSDSVV